MKFLIVYLSLLSAAVAGPLDKFMCGGDVKALAKTWNSADEWDKRKLSPEEFFYASPTSAVGEWIVVKAMSDGTGISRLTPEGRREITFTGKKCRKSERRFAQPKPLPDHVGDKELRAFVESHPQGVIYLWQNDSHESRKTLPLIQKISKKLKLPLLVLLEKGLHKGEYLKLTEDLGEEVTKRFDALEFQMRGVEDFPTTFLFKNSRILPEKITGQHTSAELEKKISQRLK